MSYQTVTDIITTTQNDLSYQVKDLLKDNSSSPSTSFGDLVSYYKTEDVDSSKTVSSSENNKDVKNEDSVEKKEEPKEVSKNEVKEETSKTEETIKHEKVSETEEIKESKVEEKEVKDSKKDVQLEPTLEEDSKEIKDSKDIEKGKKDKKLSNKDFSRIHEISEKAETSNVEQLAEDVIDTKKLSKEEVEEDKEIKSDVKEDVTSNMHAIENATNNKDSSNNLSNKNEKDNSSLFENESKKSDEVFLDKDKKIEVQDLRSPETKIDAINNDSKKAMKVSEPKMVNENTAQITMELNQNANANVLSTNSQTAASNGSNFQAMLNNQIQQSVPEFVKAGTMILKDNNQGTINLVLRPDDLGDVKLHLSLDGKSITGHITVATKEALEVFKDNAETLREAFIKNGFDGASFDVSYGGNNGSNQQMAFEEQNDGTNLLAKRVYGAQGGEGDSASVNTNAEKTSINGEYSINIVA